MQRLLTTQRGNGSYGRLFLPPVQIHARARVFSFGTLLTKSGRRLLHPDDCHHAAILMLEDVAVINEVADRRTAKIQFHRDARKGTAAEEIRHLISVVDLLLLL